VTTVAVPMHTAIRAAAVTLLTDYAQDAGIKLQVYPGRPRSIFPPTAFVDRISETIDYVGITLRQRNPIASVVVIHGRFDTADTADQKDAFVDGFLDWVTDRYHAMGANTTLGGVSVEDDPNYVPDWLPPEEQRSYYATLISLRGYAEN
jgi:hypothetical protein